MTGRPRLTREQTLAFRRRAGGLDERLPARRSLTTAARGPVTAEAESLPLPDLTRPVTVQWGG